MSVAFIDTETTGLDPVKHRIWEIAIILPDGPEAGEHCWQVRVPPGYDVDQWVLDNTRFSQDYNRDTAETVTETVLRFTELLNGRHLVGAVPSFDEERMRGMLVDFFYPQPIHLPWHYHLIDVEALAVGWLAARGETVELPWDSDELSRLVGVIPPEGDDRHTALADARWAKAIYDRIVGGEA